MQPQESAPDTVAELQKLADLHARGVLTDAEFASAKAKLIGNRARPLGDIGCLPKDALDRRPL
jgi:hypothetical protein